ncbi:hypothetical protein GGI42DRAFT_129959 [Trichoderma sp. SZMC 28013]
MLAPCLRRRLKPSQSLQGHSILPTCLAVDARFRCRSYVDKQSLPRLLLPPAAFGLGGSACAVTCKHQCPPYQSVLRRQLSKPDHLHRAYSRTVYFSPATSFPLPRVCMVEPTAEINSDDTMGSLPLVDSKMELQFPSFCLRATFLSGGESPPTAATAKEDREKQSEEGGESLRRDAVSGGQGPKR